jgi:hypothetical protein
VDLPWGKQWVNIQKNSGRTKHGLTGEGKWSTFNRKVPCCTQTWQSAFGKTIDLYGGCSSNPCLITRGSWWCLGAKIIRQRDHLYVRRQILLDCLWFPWVLDADYLEICTPRLCWSKYLPVYWVPLGFVWKWGTPPSR